MRPRRLPEGGASAASARRTCMRQNRLPQRLRRAGRFMANRQPGTLCGGAFGIWIGLCGLFVRLKSGLSFINPALLNSACGFPSHAIKIRRRTSMADNDKENAAAYWKANVRLITWSLVVWALVSYGFGILLRPLVSGIPVGERILASGSLNRVPSSCSLRSSSTTRGG